MTEILEFVRVAIEQIITFLGYPGIALVMLLENVFPPIPSELVMPFAGFLVGQGEFSFVGIVAAGTVGAVVGAVILYYVGYWADEPIVRRFVRSYGKWFLLSEDDVDRTMQFFSRYGQPVIFFGRLIPIVRSLISLPAGMDKMPMGRFLLFTTLGATIWNTVLAYAGLILGQNWDRVLVIVKQYERVTLAVVALAVIVFVVTRVAQMRNKTSMKPIAADPE